MPAAKILRYLISRDVYVLLAAVATLYTWYNPRFLDPANPKVGLMAGIALLMAVLWMTEKIPLAVTALIPVALYPFLGIMSGKAVAVTYFNHLIFLFIGGFLIALAMEKWNLHRRIAINILSIIGHSPARILLGVMTVTAFLSMWISNTATTMMMVPVILSLSRKWEEADPENGISVTKALLLGTAYAASIGGVATLIGTPPNLFFAQIVKIYFPKIPEIGFAQWFAFAFLLSITLLTAAYIYLRFFFIRTVSKVPAADTAVIKSEKKDLGKMGYEEKVVLALFITLALLWLTRPGFNVGHINIKGWKDFFPHPKWITDGNIAMLIGILLFIIPTKNRSKSRFIMDWKTAEKIPWNIILLFGGGFALAAGFKESGLTAFIGKSLSGLQDLPVVWIVLIIIASITFLTELTSNTATTETLLPILGSMAVFIHLNPLLIMIPATIAASFAFMLPIATPPNAIVFASEKIGIRDMMRAGLAMNLIGIVILLGFTFWLLIPVFHIDPQILPDWAKSLGTPR